MVAAIIKYFNNTLIAFALLATVALFGSCVRKDLYYPDYSTSKLCIVVNWPHYTTDKPLYKKAVFYPKDSTSSVFSVYLDSDSSVVEVPPGEYDIILYNWRTNEAAQSVQFSNEGSFTDFFAFTSSQSNKSDFFGDYDVYIRPDTLYAWSTINETVTISPTARSISRISTAEQDTTVQIVHTYPTPMVKNYDFEVEVIGLEYVSSVAVVAEGNSPTSLMYNKDPDMENVAHNVTTSITDWGFHCAFTAFEHRESYDQRLYFVIKCHNGGYVFEYRDLNNELDTKGTIEYVEKIVIEFDDIVYPEVPESGGGGGFEEPSIGDWVGQDQDFII